MSLFKVLSRGLRDLKHSGNDEEFLENLIAPLLASLMAVMVLISLI